MITDPGRYHYDTLVAIRPNTGLLTDYESVADALGERTPTLLSVATAMVVVLTKEGGDLAKFESRRLATLIDNLLTTKGA
jgi:hypothetical protein